MRFTTTRSRIAGSACTAGSDSGMSTVTSRPSGSEVVERAGDDLVEAGRAREQRQRAGLQPAHVQQVLHQVGKPVQRLVGGGEQLARCRRRPSARRGSAAR